jgi:predicted lipoprotein with Yx(FWY)xxD motif
MRAIRILSVGVLFAVSSWGATAHARPQARGAANTTVQLRQTSRGMILTNGSGFTLYQFTRDRRRKDMCIAISGCYEVWPYLDGSGTVTAGPGVNAAKLSTISLVYGFRQVTYYGHPLYTYSRDAGPGETSYFGAFQFGGYWYGLTAKGKRVM